MMPNFFVILLLLSSAVAALLPLRPPCAPLSVVSPYQSLWSCSDELFESWPVFWNGVTNGGELSAQLKTLGVFFLILPL
jgi:hypothetical protein